MILQSIFIKFTIEKMITDYSYFTLYSISTILLNTQNISHIKSKERNIFFIYTYLPQEEINAFILFFSIEVSLLFVL